MRYRLRAGVGHKHLHNVPEVRFDAGVASVGSRRSQNGMSTVPVVSTARPRVEIRFPKRCRDAAVRVRVVRFGSFYVDSGKGV